MFTENEIIEHIVKYLESLNHTINQALTTRQKGIDIISISPEGVNYYIEAKGGTSSRKGSANYGNAFSGAQVYSHIATAIIKCFQNYEQHKNEKHVLGIALPKDRENMIILPSIKSSLVQSNISVFLVDKYGDIENYI